mgnify:CR=1 FL=1
MTRDWNPPNLGDWLAEGDELEREVVRGLRDGFESGDWTYDSATAMLTYKPYDFGFPVSDMTTSAAALDWIVHFSHKNVESHIVGEAVRYIDQILRLQSALCGQGEERGPIDVRLLLQSRIAATLENEQS